MLPKEKWPYVPPMSITAETAARTPLTGPDPSWRVRFFFPGRPRLDEAAVADVAVAARPDAEWPEPSRPEVER